MPRLEIIPGGKIIEAKHGISLRDILFAEGVEFPCGGVGRCRRCKVRVRGGSWPISATESRLLSAAEIRDGWRLSCQGALHKDLTLEIAQWNSPILADDTAFDFTPAEGLGIAIDVGTTTIAAQLLDLSNANILAIETALNAQGAHGGDVMTRLDFAVNGGAATLATLIRCQVNDVVNRLLANSDSVPSDVRSIVLVGNTAMHHLFCALPIDQLAREPFEPYTLAPESFTGRELGWDLQNLQVTFLPPVGGFVGSDITAGIIATRLHKNLGTVALVDLGTNGEVVVARSGKLVCASTAAGPAFEGARISAGMRAATGAIYAVRHKDGGLECDVLGGGGPRGICGSGLVDAISTGLDAQIINASGRFTNNEPSWRPAGEVALQQRDVRELQLAKAAIAAGLAILLNELGASADELDEIYLAGAFGNYVNYESACRIGLVPSAPEKVIQAGNTALLGAKLALFPERRHEFESLQNQLRHVPLNERADFQEIFVEQIGFPMARPSFSGSHPAANPTCVPCIATRPALDSVASL
jgi:uncharacterized 2Fe-2S/4Fe-4S cluster protein (DUF4445 family)